MSGDYGNDYITLTDEDGDDYVLEHLDTIVIDGETYMAFLPADMDEDDDDYGLVILKVEETRDDYDDDDEAYLISIDDDDELNELYEIFFERMIDEVLEDFDEDDEDEDDD